MQRLYLFTTMVCLVLFGLLISPAYAWVNDTPAGAFTVPIHIVQRFGGRRNISDHYLAVV
ncbi:hypothetical protein [Burkholderia cenocepacia]|uniref:hypothetical protein n=1 Tax=Burkholderia cenocepacia TaxID=95486 RepID=UPI000F5B4897|nr:hypothetical protein [Burkholderia cenocepacia]